MQLHVQVQVVLCRRIPAVYFTNKVACSFSVHVCVSILPLQSNDPQLTELNLNNHMRVDANLITEVMGIVCVCACMNVCAVLIHDKKAR